MGSNGHQASDLFGEVATATPDQKLLIDKINELQNAMGQTMEIARQVMELGSRVVLASNAPEPQKKPHTIKIVLTRFDDAHRKRFADPTTGAPIPAKIEGGKDATTMKRLLDTYGQEKVEQMIDQFFSLDDEWLSQKTGYTVAAFSQRVPALIAQYGQAPKAYGLTRNTANNQRNLSVARNMIQNGR